MLDPARSYDLIGDVHGCTLTLEHLLDRLGYHKQAGVWRHASRMAVFVGDIIDRCLLYTSPSPRDLSTSRMPSSA